MSVIEQLKHIEEEILQLQKCNLSLNKENPLLAFNSKLVLEENGKIYRVENPLIIQTRLAFYEKAKEYLGFDFFLNEKIIENFSFFTITEQEKLKPFEAAPENQMSYHCINYNYSEGPVKKYQWEYQLCNRIFNDYGELKFHKLVQFCQHYQVQFIHKDNVGINNKGKIQCFDYAANISLNQEGKIVRK